MPKCPDCGHEWEEVGMVTTSKALGMVTSAPFRMDQRLSRMMRTVDLVDRHVGLPTARQEALLNLRKLFYMIHSRGEASTDDMAEYFGLEKSKTSNGLHTVGKWVRIIQSDVKWQDLIERRSTSAGSMYKLTPLAEVIVGPLTKKGGSQQPGVIDVEVIK